MPEETKKPLSRREARLSAERARDAHTSSSARAPEEKAPASEKAASKKAAASAAQKPRAHKDAGEKAGKAKAPRKHRAVYDDDAPLSPRPAKAKTGAKSAGKETASRQVARRVGKATMAGMKRFNAFSYSQGDGKRRVFRIPLTFRFFILASFIIIFLMLLALNNQSVSVDEETIAIAGLPSALENYRILHISDLHAAEFGTEQSTLLRTVNNLDYDIMLITGDMVGASGNAEPFLNFLRGLSTCRNVYFIAGDSDPGPLLSQIREEEGTLDQRVLEDWVLEAIDLGATYLDAPVSLTVGATDSATLWLSPFSQLGVSAKDAVDMYEDQLETERIGYLSGIGTDYIQYPFTDYRYRQAQDLLSAISQMGADDVHISLSHVPPMDSLLSIVQDDHSATPNEYLYAPDLVLAGHYCGGVVRVPGYGALYVPDALQGSYHGWFPDQSRVRGQITVGNTVMYVTGGLGATDAVKFPFRLFNTPEVSLLTLTGLLTDNMLIGG